MPRRKQASAKKPSVNSNRRRVIAPQRVNKGSAPVARNNAVRNQAKGFDARQSTTDYIDFHQFTTLNDGNLIFQKRIEPGTFPTLSRFASSYQRIRYHSVKFHLSAHMPTNTSGGYIMGFRPDATDRLPSDGTQRKQFVTSNPGSVKNSIWQSYDMVINARDLTNRLFYTSEGSDPREFSPGTLYVVVDGSVNQAGSMSLSATYDVTCSIPAAEYGNEGQLEPSINLGSGLFGYDGETTFRTGDVATSAEATWENIFPGVPKPFKNVVYETYTYGVKTTTESSADIQYTKYVGFGREGGNIDRVWALIPILGGGYESVPLKSPIGNTQVFGPGSKFTLADVFVLDSWVISGN